MLDDLDLDSYPDLDFDIEWSEPTILNGKSRHTENLHILPQPTLQEMPNFKVLLEGAWLVRDVKSVDDAIGVAISEAGKRLNNANLEFVEVEAGQTVCPMCGEPLDGAFLIAGTALVGLSFEMKVFDAENENHAARIAKSMIGRAMKSVPLSVIEAEEQP